MKLSFEQLKIVKERMTSAPRFFAERAFLFTLFLIAFAVAIAFSALLLSGSSLNKNSKNEVQSEFQETLFQDAFSKLQERKASFSNPNSPTSPNIF